MVEGVDNLFFSRLIYFSEWWQFYFGYFVPIVFYSRVFTLSPVEYYVCKCALGSRQCSVLVYFLVCLFRSDYIALVCDKPSLPSRFCFIYTKTFVGLLFFSVCVCVCVCGMDNH